MGCLKTIGYVLMSFVNEVLEHPMRLDTIAQGVEGRRARILRGLPDRKVADRKIGDRKIGDRKMADRKMADRPPFFCLPFSGPLFFCPPLSCREVGRQICKSPA